MPKPHCLILAAFLAFIAGCFPVELDVNDKGEVLISRQEGFFIYDPVKKKAVGISGAGGGQPVFARFHPKGKETLVVVKTGRNEFRFDLVPSGGGKPKTIFKGENTAYTLFSPDGAYIAVSRVTEDKRKDDPDIRIPELILLDPASGTRETLLKDVLVSFRWFADSKRLLVFKMEAVDKKDTTMAGHLIELDVKTRAEKPLASALVAQRTLIEMSADNKTILFTAYAAGKPKEKLSKGADRFASAKLYEWNAERGLRVFSDNAEYARFSPSGKKVILARQELLEGEILVQDLDGKEPRSLAKDVTVSTGGDLTLPGWLDEDTIFFFSDRRVYGAGGKSFSLMTIRADGTNKRNVQPALDKAVLQLSKDLPNQTAAEQPPETEPGKNERPNAGAIALPQGAGNVLIIGAAAGGGLCVVLTLGVVGLLFLRRGGAKPTRSGADSADAETATEDE